MPPLNINTIMDPAAAEEFEVDFDKNITRLYEAITNCDWEVAIATARSTPHEAETWVVRRYEESDEIMWRFLPIHSACARQPPAAVVSALLKAYPQGAHAVDDQGMLPLHYACGNQASREVIRLLLVAHPDAAKVVDPRNMLPIHYLACWGPSSVSIIDMVLVANRDVSTAKDVDGNTALDLAMEGDYNERDAVVSALRRWLEKRSSSSSSLSGTKASEDDTTRTVVSNGSNKDKKGSNDRGISTGRALSQDISNETIKLLRTEIANLKAEKKKSDAEHLERVAAVKEAAAAEKEKLQAEMTTTSIELADAKARIGELEVTVSNKETELDEKVKLIADLEAKIRDVQTERDDLRLTLADVTDDCDAQRKKAAHMSDRLGSLSASLTSMMEAQENLMKMVQTRDSRVATNSAMRRAKLQELIDSEDEILADLVEKTDDESSMEFAFEKQTKEMDAIAAVIKASRQ